MRVHGISIYKQNANKWTRCLLLFAKRSSKKTFQYLIFPITNGKNNSSNIAYQSSSLFCSCFTWRFICQCMESLFVISSTIVSADASPCIKQAFSRGDNGLLPVLWILSSTWESMEKGKASSFFMKIKYQICQASLLSETGKFHAEVFLLHMRLSCWPLNDVVHFKSKTPPSVTSLLSRLLFHMAGNLLKRPRLIMEVVSYGSSCEDQRVGEDFIDELIRKYLLSDTNRCLFYPCHWSFHLSLFRSHLQLPTVRSRERLCQGVISSPKNTFKTSTRKYSP